MVKSYIIFTGEHELHLIGKEGTSVKIESDDITEIFDKPEEAQEKIREFVNRFSAGIIRKLIISSASASELFSWVRPCFDKFIIAGGGVVKNDRGEVLVIFRKGKWDLPKGKLEGNEKVEEGAVREVQEETGLVNIKVASKLASTYHTYKMNDKNILKETVWYAMSANQEEFTPEAEEGIEEVKWVSKDELPEIYKNTYSSIISVLQKAY